MMKKLFLLFVMSIFFSVVSFGQNQTGSPSKDSKYIKVSIDKNGTIFLDKEKITLSELDDFLKTTSLNEAKFANVFPTPKKLYNVINEVKQLFDKYNIESERYKDPEFKIPAWD